MPEGLRIVIGRSELWRFLRTDSLRVAVRRSHRIADEIEQRFEDARLALGLVTDLSTADRRSDAEMVRKVIDCTADSVAERIEAGPIPPPNLMTAASKTIEQVYISTPPTRAMLGRRERPTPIE